MKLVLLIIFVFAFFKTLSMDLKWAWNSVFFVPFFIFHKTCIKGHKCTFLTLQPNTQKMGGGQIRLGTGKSITFFYSACQKFLTQSDLKLLKTKKPYYAGELLCGRWVWFCSHHHLLWELQSGLGSRQAEILIERGQARMTSLNIWTRLSWLREVSELFLLSTSFFS
jgi:hypothetical protein